MFLRAMLVPVVLAVVLLSGCTSLLPASTQDVTSDWKSYNDAKSAFDKIVPYKTTRQDLALMHIDPYKTSGVTILTFADVLAKFNVAPMLASGTVEKGLADCLNAGKRCTGLVLAQTYVKKDHTGGFIADSLQFRQQIDTSGWAISATILFVDDTVVYTLLGGQPLIVERDVQKNPLGFLQGWGSSVAPVVIPH